MTDTSFRVSIGVLALLIVGPRCLFGQGERQAICATDSVVAHQLRVHLEQAYRENSAAAHDARALWMRERATCARAGKALAKESIGFDSHDTLFVFAFMGTGGDHYAVVWANGSTGEWKYTSCFFDRNWRRRGMCFAI